MPSGKLKNENSVVRHNRTTAEDKKQAQREAAAQRKRIQRERQSALGIGIVEVSLTKGQRETLERNRVIRGGVRGEYGLDEYIETLIRRDNEQLEKQIAALGDCGKCKSSLPGGCDGLFKGDCECWHTFSYRELML
jgi:hypothetical protein